MSDSIDRQAAIDALDEEPYVWNDTPEELEVWNMWHRHKDALMSLPSVQPERKTGRWLVRDGISDAQCSECKMFFRDVYDMDNSDAFCRHCGAKMEGLKVVNDE